jgi:hypothetical protein
VTIAAVSVTFRARVRSGLMRRLVVSAVVSVAAALGSVAVADAELVAPASRLPMDSAWPVAAGPAGRALAIVPTYCDGCNEGRVAERDASGRWSLRSIAPPGLAPVFVAWGPGGTAAVIAIRNRDGAGADAFVLRRAAGAERFDAPVAIALGGAVYDNLRIAFDARGDVAVVTAVNGPDSVVRSVLVTAAPGGSFGAPHELAAGYPEGAAVAVGAGRVVVAYSRGRRVYVRSGTVGAPVGGPQLLSSRGSGPIGAAIDDAGTATVAFGRGRTFDHALVVTRARPGERFGAPAVLARSGAEFGPTPQVVAGGTTTALIWQASFSEEDVGVHAAIARGPGRFASADTISAPGLGRRGAHGQPFHPVLAVDRSGDVLLAYAYRDAVHVTVQRGAGARFGPLHLISKLGQGGWPSIAWLSDRRPLVVYHGRRGELLAATRLTGRQPNLTPPRLRVTSPPNAVNDLRAANAVTVTVRCSQACILHARASLRTHDGRTVAYGADRKIIRVGATLTQRFVFDPDGRAGRARDGARVRVTIDAQNASGASRVVVKQITL